MTDSKGPPGSRPPRPGPRGASLEEARVLRALESSALNRILTKVKLPLVPAPSVEGLTATVPSIPEPTPEELQALLGQAVLARIPREPKPPGAQSEPGDWVRFDLVCYFQRALVPELTGPGFQGVLEPDLVVRGLGQAIVGAAPGQSARVRLTLPDDFFIERLRGATVVFAVMMKELASFRPPPGDPDSPAFRQALGLPAARDAALTQMAEAARAEAREAARQSVLEQVFDQLLARAKVDVPEAAVDMLLGAEWMETQGHFLLGLGLEAEDREQAVDGWLKDPAARAAAQRRIQVAVLLSSLAVAHGLTEVTPEDLEDVARGLEASSGLSASEAVRQFQDDSGALRLLAEEIVRLRTADFLLERTALREEAP